MDDRTRGPGTNPLRRKADRTRSRLRAAFAVACLIAVICGVAVARATWTTSSRAAEAVAGHRHVVTATTVGGTSYHAGDRPSERTVTVARATWRYPADRAHTHTVPVPADTRKGDPVRVWVDDLGNPAAAPPGTAERALEAFGLGTMAAGAILLVSGVLVRVSLRIVDVRSARAWEAEWEDVEPRWTGRLRPDQGADDG
ncbi:Rv1733c family protein [Streptomyces bambusae]|uniref:DUF3592 domain-containing protein n=1 Tax=Streptomyces bambusae TaxID=1550616 RepID=A0ABS6Z155_9ACTN|nr:hypothetical protein [Streptomyces bambusae]MBW5480546.1 hypothetical protein [Streptomyces bambusae]